MKHPIYLWDGEFSTQNLDKFVSQYQGGGTLYLDSGGGYIAVQRVLMDILDGSDTEIVATNLLCSAAADLFLFVRCEKRVLPSFMGMLLHACNYDITTSDLRRHSTISHLAQQADKRDLKASLKRYKSIGISDHHLEIIKKGGDAILFPAEIRKLKIWGLRK